MDPSRLSAHTQTLAQHGMSCSVMLAGSYTQPHFNRSVPPSCISISYVWRTQNVELIYLDGLMARRQRDLLLECIIIYVISLSYRFVSLFVF